MSNNDEDGNIKRDNQMKAIQTLCFNLLTPILSALEV